MNGGTKREHETASDLRRLLAKLVDAERRVARANPRRSQHNDGARFESRILSGSTQSAEFARDARLPGELAMTTLNAVLGNPNLRRPFPFSTNPFQLVLEECSYLQRLTSFPSSMTKRRQKFRGTKLAQSGTKS
jgi:hypothetical protein